MYRDISEPVEWENAEVIRTPKGVKRLALTTSIPLAYKDEHMAGRPSTLKTMAAINTKLAIQLGDIQTFEVADKVYPWSPVPFLRSAGGYCTTWANRPSPNWFAEESMFLVNLLERDS